MQTVELIDENNNVMEYKGVRCYKLKDNLIYIDELIMSNDGIKEVRIDSETVWHKNIKGEKYENKSVEDNGHL